MFFFCSGADSAARRRWKMKAFRTGAAAALLLGGAAPATAAETISYSYDARGRLIQVARSGTVNNNVTTAHSYDKADNRVTKTTTGSPNPGPP
jgi:hypothetical protein